MELIFVKQDSTEWEYIWDFVAKHPINEGLEEPRTALNEGQEWQYMGTYKNKNKLIHEFRHLFHPRTNNVYKITFNGSETFSDDQIEKEIRIK
jgi:hypothetical protein